jgi:hypothetical protein
MCYRDTRSGNPSLLWAFAPSAPYLLLSCLSPVHAGVGCTLGVAYRILDALFTQARSSHTHTTVTNVINVTPTGKPLT